MVGLGDDDTVATGAAVGEGAAAVGTAVGLGDDDTVAAGAAVGEGAAAVGTAVGAGAARHASTASVVAEACKQGTFAAKSTSSVGGAAAS